MRLRTDAASGIDNITKQEYANNLHVNLDSLVERLHKMAYQPQPVLRVYIPKAGSNKMRPLGIPVLEDKLVQPAWSRSFRQSTNKTSLMILTAYDPGG